VTALWLAEQRDLPRDEKLWVLICEKEDRELWGIYPLANGLAPSQIRNKVKKYLENEIVDHEFLTVGDCENWTWDYIPGVKGLTRRAMRLVTKLLREE